MAVVILQIKVSSVRENGKFVNKKMRWEVGESGWSERYLRERVRLWERKKELRKTSKEGKEERRNVTQCRTVSSTTL